MVIDYMRIDMSYSITNQSPSTGYIAWSNVNISFDGSNYAITNGNTNLKYVYWLKSSPTVLQKSNTYPTLSSEDCIVFINNGGVATSVLDSAVTDGGLIVPGTVTADAIAARAITASKIAVGTITANEIASNTITASKIAAGTITATEIAAETITGAKIAAETIGAAEIAANSITASRLSIGDTSNIYPDPDMMDSAFYTGIDGLISTSALASGRNKAVLNVSASEKTAYSEWFSVSPNQQYFVEVMAVNETGTSGSCSAYVEWASLDASNVKTIVGTTTIVESTTNTSGADTNRFSASYSAGSTIRRARFKFVRNAGGDRKATFGLPVCRLKAAGELIVDGAITAVKIAAGAVTASKIAAGTITANEIASGTITGAKIAASTIGATNIAAGAITADKLTIGNFTNLVANPSFELGTTEWLSIVTGASIVTDSANASSGTKVMKRVSTANDVVVAARNGNMFECRAGDQFYLKGLIKSTSDATGTTEWRISWRNNATTEIGVSVLSWTPSTSYVAKDGIFTAPANTAYAVVEAFSRNQTAGTWYWGEVYCSSATTSTMIVNGAITTSKIAADAVTAAQIAAGTITATEIAAGTITGAKIAAGTITAANIAANTITASQIAAGAITSDEIAANAITSAKIAANAITASHIAAGSINASKISIGDFTNLAVDPHGDMGASIFGSTVSVVSVGGGNNAYRCAAGVRDSTSDGWIAVKAGEQYYFSADMNWVSNGTATSTLGFWVRKSDGTTVNCIGGCSTSDTSAGWKSVSGEITILDGGERAHLWWQRQGTSGDPASCGVWNMRNVQIRKKTTGGSLIVAGTITATEIADATITNAKIGTVIQSNNYVAGSTGWKIDKSGSAEFNGILNAKQLIGVVNRGAYWNSSTFDACVNTTAINPAPTGGRSVSNGNKNIYKTISNPNNYPCSFIVSGIVFLVRGDVSCQLSLYTSSGESLGNSTIATSSMPGVTSTYIGLPVGFPYQTIGPVSVTVYVPANTTYTNILAKVSARCEEGYRGRIVGIGSMDENGFFTQLII